MKEKEKKQLKCFKWMVPREKQLCIAMLVVLNALTYKSLHNSKKQNMYTAKNDS